MSGLASLQGRGMALQDDPQVAEFAHRFEQIQIYRDSSDDLIKDVILWSKHLQATLGAENEHLKGQVLDLQLDLTDAVKSRRELQQQLQEAETKIDSMAQAYDILKKQNPYIAVLIDGDGLLFNEHWIRQGIEGGRKAANALRAVLLNECGSHADAIEIIAKVYVNLGDLSRVMKNAGVIEKESDLRNFSLGFSRNSHFDLVDVGSGKEEADEKVREMTKWHLRNNNCRQVVLGCSHDSGYAPFLHNLLRDDLTKQRITILEGFPTHRLLVETGVNIISFPKLFRSDKLLDKPMTNGFQQRPISNGVPGLQPLPAPVSAPVSSPPVVAASVPPPSSTPVPPPSSYARAIKSASPPPQMTLPLQPKPKASAPAAQVSKPAAWNPGPRGIDPPILVSESAMNNIKKRKDSNKLCNNHYLRGPCAKGDSCCFEHKYKPSPDEINAIAFLARLNPCTNGQECDVQDCIYGHHCPSVQNGRCGHPYCKFLPEDHPPGTTYRKAPKDYDNY